MTRRICPLVLALGIATPGCGGDPSPAPKSAQAASAKPKKKAMSVSSDRGALSQHDVAEAFRGLERPVQRCLERGTRRVAALGGTFEVAVRIDPDGQAKWAYMKKSTLGDRETESCILEAVRSKRWPLPLGGDGEAEHTFAVESTVPVAKFKASRMKSARKGIWRKVSRCLQPARGRYMATLYIQRDGRVASAGAAPPNAKGEAKIDCLVDELRTFKFGRQRARLSKVTFGIPW
jgi:hypothetical protein